MPRAIGEPRSDHAGDAPPISDAPKQSISWLALAHPCASQHLDILVQWARLLKRVFNIDMDRCPNCQGRLTIIAAIEDPSTIAKILKHLELPARAPPRTPARILHSTNAPSLRKPSPTLPDAAENYTDCSPYPMLHILREEVLERAIDNYPDVEEIPKRNIQTRSEFGAEHMRHLLGQRLRGES